ncbi:MAG: DUF488 domain-containing protein [Alphaproteobacteria bacterium]|nr:DUF488 domain-containing protein [Alphaproteobacteria bacterium]
MPKIRVKRIHEPAAKTDGHRLLVDRLWPRGISKDKAALDDWMKEIAPSTKLRQWFGHDPKRWDGFRRRYAAELDQQPERVAEIRNLAAKRRVTLLYSARDADHNQAVALAEYLEGKG